MGRRFLFMAGFCVLLAGWVGSATAARIDPELQRLLAGRADGEILPVLMLFPQSPDAEDLEILLENSTPEKRRKSAIAALKRATRKVQTEAWQVLEGSLGTGSLAYADMLYFAGAIAFGGDRDMILAVAAAENTDDAVLFLDREYDVLSRASATRDDLEAAPGDTVWNVLYVHADRVWNELGLTGDGILVGHLDTGVDASHIDLRNRLWTNTGEIPDNGLDDDGNGFVDDVHGWDFGDGDNDPADDAVNGGHGTHTAGTLLGDGTGGILTGVAPGARLLPAKVFTSDGVSSLGRIWAGQQYCVEMGARIITMSLGIKGEIPATYLRTDRVNAAAIRAAGVAIFNSAGNYHDEFEPPIELGMTARIPAPWNAMSVPYSSIGGVITIGATGYKDDSAYSDGSRGPADWGDVDPWYDWPYEPGPGLIKPDVSAPGVGIRSTLPGNLYSGETWSGTSMACPHVAGVAALMLQKNYSLSPAGLDSLLEKTARDLGAAGKDPVFGAGLVDAFAAVEAVPVVYGPNLERVVYHGDVGGDGVLDPGETVDVVFDVENVGVYPATGVVGQLTVDGSAYVSVAGGAAVFPAIYPEQTGDNAADPFRLEIDPSTPQGHVFVMTLTLSTTEGFERVYDVQGYVGLPEFRTHDAGRVYLTVTSRGSLGYLSDAQLQGDGMGFDGGPNTIFVSSLWGGDGPDYMCNNDLSASGADPSEWQPRLDPNGNVAVLDAAEGVQTFAMAFTDSGHAKPRGIEVELVSRAFGETLRADLVELDYVVRNAGEQAVDGYYVGLFVDWDVIDSLGNVGQVDLATRSVWIGMPDGPVFGMALLGDAPAGNVTLVDNAVYVYPASHVLDGNKYDLLRGAASQTRGDEPADLSALVSAGPFHLAPGEGVHVPLVLAYGADVDDFMANITEAGAGQGPPLGTDPGETPAVDAALLLGPNHPNPFNPSTGIRFSLPTAGSATLAVYDLEGRRVRLLLQDDLAAGPHLVRWHGDDDGGAAVASGIYFYKLTAGGRTLTRKMMLVK